MVLISTLKPYIPKIPEEFCTNPYDVISKEEEIELKRNPNSLIHLILPDGHGEQVYQNALKAFERFKEEHLIIREKEASIFVYRQESDAFSHQGLILGVSLNDYEKGAIVKHEHTREKPLEDRTKHITATNVSAGLVWTVFKANKKINSLIESIKNKEPLLDFNKYNYIIADKTWVDHEWLANLFIFLIYNKFGYICLNILFALVILCALIVQNVFIQKNITKNG